MTKSLPINQKESEIRAAIKEYLQWTGWFVFHHLQGLGCYPGLPDLEAVKDGQTVYIEVKTFTGKQRPDQIQFQADVEAHGGTYIVARGVEDVEQLNRKGVKTS